MENESKVSAEVTSCDANPRVRIPIMIGSIPLTDSAPERAATASKAGPNQLSASTPFPPRPDAVGEASAMILHPSAPAVDLPMPTAPVCDSYDLPTYEEAVHGTSKGGFIPKYPMFRRNTSYSMDE